ncbi:hypothetical protein [Nocardia farcinica]|uniref:hypothetical protein n=2 Tax=Nocardia farcinica TaxID=37329 RepID=UPI002456CBCE|nr:hypothetical protein [Nocardia farcinica]
MAYAMALYDMFYDELRATLRAPSVSRNTFQAWAIAESECADVRTGRECRPSVRHLSRRILRSPRTVKRCRELARLLDLRQVVFHGRQRTKLERLDSWRRGDSWRGWTAEAALIESPAYAHLVDKAVIDSLLEQDFVTPLPRSGGSLSLSRSSSVTSVTNVSERRAPRGKDKKGRSRKPRAYDSRALLLAARVRSDERFPVWVRRLGVQGLAAVLTRRAVAGWQADDVHAALDEVYLSGRRIFDRPRDPYAYLAYLLKPVPVDEPPMLLDRAREAMLELEYQAKQRAEAAHRRAEAMSKAVAAPDSPARAAAMAVARAAGHRAISSAATDRAEAEAARREIARLARED